VLQYRRVGPQRVDSAWTDIPSDGGARLSGRPAVAAWIPPSQDARVDFFAVEADSRTLVRTYRQNSAWGPWEELWPDVSSRLTACTLGDEKRTRADVWYARGSGIVGHFSSEQGNTTAAPPGFRHDDILEREAVGTGPGAPGLTCHEGDITSNLVLYDGEDGTVSNRQWNVPNAAWSQPTVLSESEKFVDEPTVVDISSTRFDFFGVGANQRLHHFNWVGGTLSDLETVGEGIASAPSAVAVSEDRIDVVAVGTDGKLKHRSLLGTTWSTGWDDLGVVSTGAPLLVVLDGDVYIFVTDEDGLSFAVVNGENVGTRWNIRDGLTRL
jgi:hypothetical protein